MKILDASKAIYIGRKWTLPLYFTDPKIAIESSASGTITAVGEHSLSNGDRVYVANHYNASTVRSTLNGIGTVADKTATTFKNGLTSNGTGNKTGYFGKCQNNAGKTITAQIRELAGEDATLIVTPTMVKTDADGKVLLSLTAAQTDDAVFTARQGGTCVLEVVVDDEPKVLLTLQILKRVYQ